MNSALKLKERDVAKPISDFMQYRGWRRVRNNVVCATNPVTGHYVASGEKGMADLLFLRYDRNVPPQAMALWVETKSRTGRLSERQEKWQAEEMAMGAIVITVRSFEEFRDWYQETLGWLHTAKGPAVPGNLDLFSERSPGKDTG
jgi:hypothetical protein